MPRGGRTVSPDISYALLGRTWGGEARVIGSWCRWRVGAGQTAPFPPHKYRLVFWVGYGERMPAIPECRLVA